MLEKCIIYTNEKCFEVMNKNGEILENDIVYVGPYNLDIKALDYLLKFRQNNATRPDAVVPDVIANIIKENLQVYQDYDTMLAFADDFEYEAAVFSQLSPEEKEKVLYSGLGIKEFHLDCYPKDGRGRKRTRINIDGRQAFLMKQKGDKVRKRASRGNTKKAQIEKLYNIYTNLAKEIKEKYNADFTPAEFDAVCALLTNLNPQSSNREAAEKLSCYPNCIKMGVALTLLQLTRNIEISNYAADILAPEFQMITEYMITKPSASFKGLMKEEQTKDAKDSHVKQN